MNKVTRTLCLVAAGMLAFGLALSGFAWLLGASRNIAVAPWDQYGNSEYGINPKYAIDKEEELPSFSSIDLESNHQTLYVQEGKTFSISVKYDQRYSDVTWSVQDEVLTVEEMLTDKSGWHRGFPWNMMGDNWKTGKMVITVPAGTQLSDVKINCDLGEINIENIVAATLDVEADMGGVSITSVNVGHLRADLDMGGLTIQKSAADTASISCDAGGVQTKEFTCRQRFEGEINAGGAELRGDFRGQTIVSCDMGGIAMYLSGSRAEYGYRMDTDMGGIEVDGQDRGSSASQAAVSGNDSLELSASMGGIEVFFEH